MKSESRTRHKRSSRYQRLAALFGGPLGVALIGRPELAGDLERALRSCPGHESLICRATGGVPRVCFVQKMEQLAASAARGGERRREWERSFIENEMRHCLATFERTFPPELAVVLEYAKNEIEDDLAYLTREIAQ